ncbi:MAG: hypoxanthine phosphoribosyltransferase [Thermodesulfovibrionales bacterium]
MVIGRPLLTVDQIQGKVRELADRISEDYEGRDLLVVPILRGAFMFASDLIRAIRIPLTLDFVVASSYVKANTTGEVKMHCDVREDLKDRNVLLVEDIVDTGITLNYVRELFLQREPADLKVCAFLDKKERRVVDVPLDYKGYEIPNVYVVGYGLDYDNKYRNLPYVAVFKKST